MNFNKINNITGWIVCAIACAVYILTAEARGSLWDCGEFVSSCFKLQIPHPPGAPLFVIMGRIFIVLFGDNPMTAAKAVNVMSALASGFAILFLFWTITHFARKIYQKKSPELTGEQVFTVMAAGLVGALAFTFSDSMWYSAVEGEVYGSSSFLTALVFWLILKWEHKADEPGADRWIILLFFVIGLSIGIHLLNLLTIPAIVMVYYFRRYKVTNRGIFWAFIVGCVITGFVQKFVIQYTITGSGIFDRWFVNGLGLPFFSGFTTYFILLAIVIVIGIRRADRLINNFTGFAVWLSVFVFLFSFPFITSFFTFILFAAGTALLVYGAYHNKNKILDFLKLGLWCFAFMLIGYSTYLTTMVRSAANPSVDMYNVDNPMSLVGYLGREQYGDFPLIYGQTFAAEIKRNPDGTPAVKEKGYRWQKGKDKYINIGKNFEYEYDPEDMMFLPRIWDGSNDQGHANYYRSWLGLGNDEKPTYMDNIKWAFQYQIGWMYLRYFGWNFVGRQNDIQGTGNVRDGNTITGISFIDNLFLGDQSKLPDSIRNNKAHNTLFALPLILGLIGLFYQYKRHNGDFLVTFLLFFFTGFAIVFYLNAAGPQPRERDYVFAGSFYAFAIWIGIGVMMVKEWFEKVTSGKIAGFAAATICTLAVPVIMGFQEWDDHDRSKKLLAPDLAKDYLESCAPNAILFTFGDNDTYPLWYAQEVEGVRPDIRVVNYSLLGIDWYINELRYKINQSDPVDLLWGPDKTEGDKRNVVYFDARPNIPQNQYVYLDQVLTDIIGSDNPANMITYGADNAFNTFPVRKFAVPVDTALVRENGTVNPGDKVLPELRFDLSPNKTALMKNDLAVLNVIAANKWKRPIYFTSQFNELGFGQYLRADGLSYRLVPVQPKENDNVNDEVAYNNMMKKFAFGNADIKGVYFDEENRRHLLTIRQAYASAASSLADDGEKDKAKQLLEKCDKGMDISNMPYAMVSRFNQHNVVGVSMMDAAYKADYKELADKIERALKRDIEQQLSYYASLGNMSVQELLQHMQDPDGLASKQRTLYSEIDQTFRLQNYLNYVEGKYKAPAVNPETPAVIKTDSPGAKTDSSKK
ncbi:MAG: MFS transporter [Sphingobacteriales bacterium]|nr:MFS transporter [Sphingobacteriales bacterium]OJY85753.1 MAG: membrane protein [Sphingobacteriales bacterium 44-15]